MNLYLLTQTITYGYDTFDSCIVAATSPKEAKIIHPSIKNWDGSIERFSTWCEPKDVTATIIGVANKRITKGVVLASFNAG